MVWTASARNPRPDEAHVLDLVADSVCSLVSSLLCLRGELR
jgi:hypothetical protein